MDNNIIQNKWHNLYWFARMLINTDKYGGIGKDSKVLKHLATSLRLIKHENKNLEKSEILKIQKSNLEIYLLERYKNAPKKTYKIKQLIHDLDEMIKDCEDIDVFILTCDQIMLPINEAIHNIPNNDKEFAETISKSFLDIQGQKGLATVIKKWDDLGTKGCLTAERVEIVKAFSVLRSILEENRFKNNDKDVILTAFVQEFERRAGQKRKSRAGGSLEDVTSFILNYYSIPTTHAPHHFQADIEIDKWIKTKDAWLIGISCKRTLRERWKQVSSADSDILSKYKIKQLYHIITYDDDLSDDKLTLLGGQRHIFYLPDDSEKLSRATSHVGLKNYVRPISELINDIKQQLL